MRNSELVLNPVWSSAVQHSLVSGEAGRRFLTHPYISDALAANIGLTEKVLPDLRTGGYVNPDKWVPRAELRKYLLFAGCENTQELKQYVFDEIDTLNIPTHNIKKALDIVEKAMTGMTRRTGEEGFAHILRCVKRGIDFIKVVSDKKEKGQIFWPFTLEAAEAILIGLALHDLGEDRRKVVVEGVETEEPIGNVSLEYKASDYGGLLVTGFGKGTQAQELLKLKPNVAFGILKALEALNRNEIRDEESVDFLLRKQLGDLPKSNLDLYRNIFLLSLGIVIKNIDRVENLSTHCFRWDNQKKLFVPLEKKQVIKKANETFEQFENVEKFMASLLGSINLRVPFQNPDDRRTGKIYPVWFHDQTTMSYFPSHWGIKILLGLGPDDIFAIDHLEREGVKGLPRLK